jgi:hypothetical protein
VGRDRHHAGRQQAGDAQEVRQVRVSWACGREATTSWKIKVT